MRDHLNKLLPYLSILSSDIFSFDDPLGNDFISLKDALEAKIEAKSKEKKQVVFNKAVDRRILLCK